MPEWGTLNKALDGIIARDRRIAELEKESNDFDTEMAIVAKALTAAFEDGRLNANDKRNEQLSDIAESKKWQTEQVDVLRERIAELEAAIQSAPHSQDCRCLWSDEACNCWKRAALAGKESER